MGLELQIKTADIAKFTEEISKRQMRKTAAAVAALQLELVADAFKAQGQPSKPWPKMWADKFTGSVPMKQQDAVTKAQASVVAAEASLESALNAPRYVASRIAKAQSKLDKARENLAKKTKNQQPATSYRKGGERLSDTSGLRNSFFNKHRFVFDKDMICVVASSAFYALYHQNGFRTNGPNFIPLTLKARRTHVKGNDPFLEGLEEGVDYIMAWNGVNVPPSPMIDYADPIVKKRIADTITEAFFHGA